MRVFVIKTSEGRIHDIFCDGDSYAQGLEYAQSIAEGWTTRYPEDPATVFVLEGELKEI